ncbi:hypothetical protein, partial [Tautonia rosea]|uniref:hypothetical protein n=1 Tax=Tautonia rosea TaxID=2728037 RepID=UPI0019D01EC6
MDDKLGPPLPPRQSRVDHAGESEHEEDEETAERCDASAADDLSHGEKSREGRLTTKLSGPDRREKAETDQEEP